MSETQGCGCYGGGGFLGLGNDWVWIIVVIFFILIFCNNNNGFNNGCCR